MKEEKSEDLEKDNSVKAENKKKIDKSKNKKEKKSKKDKKPKLTKEQKLEQKGNFGERFSLRFRKKLVANKARTILLVITLLAVFVALNAWARTKATAQIDLTENKIYTLSQTSKDQIQSIEKEITIYIYGYDESSNYVTFVKQYAEYNKNIKYEIVTTESNYEIVNRYGLDDSSSGSMVVVCGDKDVTLNPSEDFSTYDYQNGSYTTVDLTEEKITNAILNVSTDNPKKIYLVTDHGEYVEKYVSTLVDDLENVVYECETLKLLSATEIPEDCDVLIFLNPESDITENEAQIVKNYVNNGGNMFVSWFKDINSTTDFTNFQSVLDLYGAGVEKGLLYEGNSNYYYYYPYYLMPSASSSSSVTEDIANSGYRLLLLESQRVLENTVQEENVTISKEKLLTTSSSCYNITDVDAINQGLSLDGMDQDSYAIAEKYTRTINISGDSSETKTIDSNLILVGSSTFLLDQNGVLGYDADKSFILNSFAALAGENDLITVQKYTSSSTAFRFSPTTLADAIVKVVIFGIPIIIIAVGIIIWAVRRRKR